MHDRAAARLAGATDREIHETIAMAGLVRHWSTLLNGLEVERPSFKRDIDRLVRTAREHTPKAARH